MIGRTNAGGGGSSVGGKLTVTAPANTNVTAKLGDKIKTRNSGADGSAVFKGLGQGSWDISIANAEQTITVPVPITTDYFTTIAFFSSKIAVTYPAGSTCTCTNGNTTYTAPNTSGSYTFSVPRTGTWTVKITNGTSTKSQDVSITADGQNVAITISYWNGELFDNGEQYTDHTGGWTASNGGGGQSVYPHLQANGSGFAHVRTNNKVDVTKYNRLKFTGTFKIWSYSSSANSGFGLADHKMAWNTITYVAALKNFTDLSNGSLDISTVSGSYYITAHTYAGDGLSGSIDMSKVWLE